MTTDFFVRGSRPEELEEVVAATSAAFKIPMPNNSYRNFLSIKIPDPENIRVLFHKQGGSKKIIGSNTIFRFQAHFGPLLLDAGGLAWVGIHPDYQRKKLGLLLLDDCISYLEKAHCDLCFLYTSTMVFYHQRGWEVGFGVYKWVLPIIKLAGSDISKKAPRLRLFTLYDLPHIEKIYAESNAVHPGTCVRDNSYWSRVLRVHPEIFERLYCFEDGTSILAYILLEERGKSPANQLIVEEYGIQTSLSSKNKLGLEKSLLDALKILATEKSCTELGFSLPPTYSLVERIMPLGARDLSSLFTGLMVRIMDLDSFLVKWIVFYNETVVPLLKAVELRKIANTEIILNVEGRGILLHKDGAKMHLEKINDFPPHTPQVPVERSVFAILALGNATPNDLVESEMWECPQQFLPFFNCIFLDIHFMIYQLDKF